VAGIGVDQESGHRVGERDERGGEQFPHVPERRDVIESAAERFARVQTPEETRADDRTQDTCQRGGLSVVSGGIADRHRDPPAGKMYHVDPVAAEAARYRLLAPRHLEERRTGGVTSGGHDHLALPSSLRQRNRPRGTAFEADFRPCDPPVRTHLDVGKSAAFGQASRYSL
jgi:hypothetical protein